MYRLRLQSIFTLQRQIKGCNSGMPYYRSATCAKLDSCQRLRSKLCVAQSTLLMQEKTFVTSHPLNKKGKLQRNSYANKRNADTYSNKSDVPAPRKTRKPPVAQMPLIAEMVAGSQSTFSGDDSTQMLGGMHSFADEIDASELSDDDLEGEIVDELELSEEEGDSYFDDIETELTETQEVLEMSSYPENEFNDENIEYVEDFSLHSKYDIAKLEKDKKRKKIQTLFGGPDPTIPMSETPCSGCGATMHCQDPGIPGIHCHPKLKQNFYSIMTSLG